MHLFPIPVGTYLKTGVGTFFFVISLYNNQHRMRISIVNEN